MNCKNNNSDTGLLKQVFTLGNINRANQKNSSVKP